MERKNMSTKRGKCGGIKGKKEQVRMRGNEVVGGGREERTVIIVEIKGTCTYSHNRLME